MKKRLILLFIMLIPFAYSMECITYHDCSERDCIGSSRICFQGNCVYTECISIEQEQLYYDNPALGETVINVDSIISLGGKFILFAVAALAIGLMFPMLKLHKKVKTVAVIVFAVAALIFGLYLFAGEDVFYKILGVPTKQWDSHLADNYVISVANQEELEIDETVLASSADIKGGKEYTLGGPAYENSVLILELGIDKDLEEIGIRIPNSELRQHLVNKHSVYLYENQLYETYAWKKDSLVFIVSGEKEQTRELARLLLAGVNETIIQKMPLNIEPEEQQTMPETNMPPVINVLYPKAGSYVSDNPVHFQITDNDSRIDAATLRVYGVEGFMGSDCIVIDGLYNCSFESKPKPGKNKLVIEVADEHGGKAVEETTYVFDNSGWRFVALYPENQSYVNTANINFQVSDDVSGINASSFLITGLNISLLSCNNIKNGKECLIENANLSEGKHIISIEGSDNALNHDQASMEFVYDKTRPVIEITTKGFTVRDNIKLMNNSLFLDNKRYSLSNCYPINKVYHCRYSKHIMSLSVMDQAGNSFTLENKLIR